MIGKDIQERYDGDLMGAFSDEIEIRYPFEYFNSQCFATMETRTATLYRHVLAHADASPKAEEYSRLLLPMWGEGHVGMLLGAVAWG
jgi:hypothetical protein